MDYEEYRLLTIDSDENEEEDFYEKADRIYDESKDN